METIPSIKFKTINKMNFIYKISIEGILTRDEADLVYLHLKSHPDTERYCKQGEFGFAFVNYYAGIDVDRKFSFREIDTMLKSLEWRCELHEKNVDFSLKMPIIEKLHSWCNAINNEYKRLNNGK